MAELRPAGLGVLLRRLHHEWARQEAIYDLPSREMHRGDPALDTSVVFHGHRASTPLGPAAGPHDQLVQNIVLSWLGGGRIIELKTVQILDQLKIPRPCIDVANIGYNVEWSQELRLEESLREYVAASMVLDILRDGAPAAFGGAAADSETILDMSVGYDLEGIRSRPVRHWIETMMSAGPIIDSLRSEIPDEFAGYRDFPFRTRVSDSITLSTFHGCPADEIERITDFLLREVGVHMTVKLNPTLLGKARVDALLREQMGYEEIEAPADAFDKDLKWDECLQILERLDRTARSLGRRLGVKFSNTLVVKNHKSFFPASEQSMYLSGAPLHVLTMNLVRDFRAATGHRYPISFSAGIDQHNFPDAVGLGFTPVTVCTDLLRPGGYGRMHKYLENLHGRMRKLGVTNVADFVLAAEGNGTEAVRRAVEGVLESIPAGAAEGPESNARRILTDVGHEAEQRILARGGGARDLLASAAIRLRAGLGAAAESPHIVQALAKSAELSQEAVAIAASLNTPAVVERTTEDPRYRAARNRGVPRKIGSHLALFDCVSCHKCVPVCPNDANFRYDVEPVEVEYSEIVVTTRGPAVIPRGVFRAGRETQWATFHDFCNECGNCDVFCPEDGAPYVEKPRVFGSRETYAADADRDGFLILRDGAAWSMSGRMAGREYRLHWDDEAGGGEKPARYGDGRIEADVERGSGRPLAVRVGAEAPVGHALSMREFLVMRTILRGVLDARRANYVNAAAP